MRRICAQRRRREGDDEAGGQAVFEHASFGFFYHLIPLMNADLLKFVDSLRLGRPSFEDDKDKDDDEDEDGEEDEEDDDDEDDDDVDDDDEDGVEDGDGEDAPYY
jgi:hypothetical protein